MEQLWRFSALSNTNINMKWLLDNNTTWIQNKTYTRQVLFKHTTYNKSTNKSSFRQSDGWKTAVWFTVVNVQVHTVLHTSTFTMVNTKCTVCKKCLWNESLVEVTVSPYQMLSWYQMWIKCCDSENRQVFLKADIFALQLLYLTALRSTGDNVLENVQMINKFWWYGGKDERMM